MKTFLYMVLLLLMGFHVACASDKTDIRKDKKPRDNLEALLSQVQTQAADLTSYQCRLSYRVDQPDFESRTIHEGWMYYMRCQKESRLRISFETLKQDDQKPQPYIVHYLFDGVWLTIIDHQLKSVQKHQMADVNEPVDAFDLAGRELPIIGFTGIEQLKDDFAMNILPAQTKDVKKNICLRLQSRIGSRYEHDYRTITFWFDQHIWLPINIEAVTPEGDIYHIHFSKAKINKGIDDKLFKVLIPKGFNEPDVFPLETQGGEL